MNRWQRTLLINLAEILLLLALHGVLIRYMADHDVVSRIFAAGSHVPRGTLAAAGFFLLVRFLVVLALPGMILSRCGLILFDWINTPGTQPEKNR